MKEGSLWIQATDDERKRRREDAIVMQLLQNRDNLSSTASVILWSVYLIGMFAILVTWEALTDETVLLNLCLGEMKFMFKRLMEDWVILEKKRIQLLISRVDEDEIHLQKCRQRVKESHDSERECTKEQFFH